MSDPVDPGSICDRSDLTVMSCGHCRKAGLYVPADQGLAASKTGMTLDGIEELTLSIDAMGQVWSSPGVYDGEFVAPDEAFQRGKFGRGKPGMDNGR